MTKRLLAPLTMAASRFSSDHHGEGRGIWGWTPKNAQTEFEASWRRAVIGQVLVLRVLFRRSKENTPTG